MRRRRRDSAVTLFSFLDILAAAVGTLVLVIAAMLALSIPEIEQRIESNQGTNQRIPVFVECRDEGLLLHPEGLAIARAEIESSSNWASLLEMLAGSTDQRYLVLLVRPGGLSSFQLAESMARTRDLEVGYDPIYAAGPVVIESGEQDS